MRSNQPDHSSRSHWRQVRVSRPSLAAVAGEYLSRGWPVIPLVGKQPAIAWKGFQSRRPTSLEVERWFTTKEVRPTGIGILTGYLSRLVVVDCDSRDDAAFWQEHHPSPPLVAQTGGGGIHFYYAMPKGSEVRNRAGVLGRKIDIRGEGGYVAAPPSLHPNGQAYAWQIFDWAATLPPYDANWIADDSRPARLPRCEQTTIIRNAVAYISRIRAVAGQGGHNATFRAACKLRDAGLAQEEALTVLSAWNERNASPTWSAAELAHKISSAFSPPP